MSNVLVRCSAAEFVSLIEEFSSELAETITLYPEGATCAVTGQIVPEGMVHVALRGTDPFITRELECRGWGVVS